MTSEPEGLPPEVLEHIKLVFFQDCEDLLAELETGLLALKAGERDPEIVNTVFRAVHSVKGGAGNFGLDALVEFSHVFESVLADIRGERLALEADVLTLLLRAADMLADHVKVARGGGAVDTVRTDDIKSALSKLIVGADTEEVVPDDELSSILCEEPTAQVRDWMIRLRPHSDLYAKANEVLALLRELRRFGETTVALNEDEIPLITDLEPEQAYLTWTVSLRSSCEEAAIREVFEFVERDCDVELTSQQLRVAPVVSAIADAVAPLAPVAEVRPADLRTAAPSAAPPAGAAEAATEPSAKASETIRVEVERVDRLVNLVGELVINQAMLTQHMLASGIAANQIDVALEDLDHLTRDIQDSVMAMRAQPVKSVFQRMSRLVREVEVATGKQVNLVINGSATEVDRTVIERLTDPLTHIVRNAIDHGIEAPATRLASNKPAQGTLRISAAHRSGRVVIETNDDGQGIDRERVQKIAIERQLIAADAVLSEHDVDNLIFLPGFSTASQVSELSGRGVGMDIVKRGVQALGGRISVASKKGEGSTFTLSLPLTLAVLDGMTVFVAGQSLIAPLTAPLETVQPKASDVYQLGASAKLIKYRGEFVPLIDLGVLFGYREGELEPTKGVALMVEDDVGERVGLLVEDILGQRQVVIKSLQANYRAVDGIAAATILGDGRVALILDVNAIVASQKRGVTAVQQRAATG